jgi:hypothetical protein
MLKLPTYRVAKPAREGGDGLTDTLELIVRHVLHTVGRHKQGTALCRHAKKVDEHQARRNAILKKTTEHRNYTWRGCNIKQF